MNNKSKNEAQYLSLDKYEEDLREAQTADLEDLQALAPIQELILRDEADFTRKDVVTGFQRAYKMMGGELGLANWGMHNKTAFYKLYAKLLPSQASSALGESNELVIKHVLPRTALDE